MPQLHIEDYLPQWNSEQEKVLFPAGLLPLFWLLVWQVEGQGGKFPGKHESFHEWKGLDQVVLEWGQVHYTSQIGSGSKVVEILLS